MMIETPFKQSTGTVLPAWIDLNGHMNVGYYHVAFDMAADPFFLWLGLTPQVREDYHFRRLRWSHTFISCVK